MEVVRGFSKMDNNGNETLLAVFENGCMKQTAMQPISDQFNGHKYYKVDPTTVNINEWEYIGTYMFRS